jgi:hypothetical protein
MVLNWAISSISLPAIHRFHAIPVSVIGEFFTQTRT